jgi:hypothetical protein
MYGTGVVRKRPLAALVAASLFVAACLFAADWAEKQELAERIAQVNETVDPDAAEGR